MPERAYKRGHQRVNARVPDIQRGQAKLAELQAFLTPPAPSGHPPFPAPNHPRKAGVEGSNPSVGSFRRAKSGLSFCPPGSRAYETRTNLTPAHV
jgi:hypothetical protein